VETPESVTTGMQQSSNASPRQPNNTFKGQRKSLAERSLGQEMIKCP
jgi:hypothetical protein